MDINIVWFQNAKISTLVYSDDVFSVLLLHRYKLILVFLDDTFFIWQEVLTNDGNSSINSPVNNQTIVLLYILQKGLKNVFDEAILAALEPPEPKKNKRCLVL